MKRSLLFPCLSFLAALLSFVAVPQGMSADSPREFKDLLQSVEKDLSKLRSGSDKEKAAVDLSRELTKAEGNKEAALKFKVTKVEKWHFPDGNTSGWRINSSEEKVREGGVNLNVSRKTK